MATATKKTLTAKVTKPQIVKRVHQAIASLGDVETTMMMRPKPPAAWIPVLQKKRLVDAKGHHTASGAAVRAWLKEPYPYKADDAAVRAYFGELKRRKIAGRSKDWPYDEAPDWVAGGRKGRKTVAPPLRKMRSPVGPHREPFEVDAEYTFKVRHQTATVRVYGVGDEYMTFTTWTGAQGDQLPLGAVRGTALYPTPRAAATAEMKKRKGTGLTLTYAGLGAEPVGPSRGPKKIRAKKKRNAGGINYLAAGVVGAVAYLGYRLFKGKRKVAPAPQGPVLPPPAPKPGVQVPDTPYAAGGETVLKLPAGAEFVVTWDELSPWNYVAQDTDDVQAIDSDDGSVRFHVVTQLPTGGVDQVYVQAVDENDDVLGEHKFTVIGP